MKSSTNKRRRAQSGATAATVLSVSLAVHLGIAAVATNVGVGSRNRVRAKRASLAPDDGVSCRSDANLVMLARHSFCLLPRGNTLMCWEQAWDDYRLDVLVCDSLQENEAIESSNVAFLSPEEIDRLQPESLLDIPPLDKVEVAKLQEEKIEEKEKEIQEQVSNPTRSGQVIEVVPPELEAIPEDTRFLSEFNTAVEKETVARGSTQEMVANPQAAELPAVANQPTGSESVAADNRNLSPPPSSVAGAENKQSRSSLFSMRATPSRAPTRAGDLQGSNIVSDDGVVAKKGDGSLSKKWQSAEAGSANSTAVPSGPTSVPSNLRLDRGMAARALGGGSVDKLDGVASGDVTALNSKQWKFASYFNRMKRMVAAKWRPARLYAQRDPTGHVYGIKNRETVLEVFLTADGHFKNATVVRSSGVGFLDNEAIAAFERSQPFPNPPRGLINASTGGIRFSFGFSFEVGAKRDVWNIFR